MIELLCWANVVFLNQQIIIPEKLQNMVTKDVATTRIEDGAKRGWAL